MPKNIEDMIVPERKKSIRDIPIPEGRKRFNGIGTEIKPNENNIQPESFSPSHRAPVLARRKRRGLWISVGVATFFLIFAILSILNGATLAYVPKSASLSFDNDTFIAHKTGDKGLLFSVIKLSREKSLEAPAQGEESVERKSSGSIIIYNTTNKSQKFRATTRFSTPDGKVFQVTDAIVVPAKKVIGGVNKPGTLEVRVYAEFPGAEYNIGLSDFTLPGLKGSTLYSSVYARSKTEMTGGFKGVEKIVGAEDRERIKKELEISLSDELVSEAKAQLPKDFVLIPTISSFVYEDLPQSESTDEAKAMLNMRGNLLGIIFKKSDLATLLALEKITIAPGEIVDIQELTAISFSLVGANESDPLQLDEIKFSATGSALGVWRTDEVALRADLAGRPKRDLVSVLNNYPTIISAKATIRPFWKTSFPSSGAKIKIKGPLVD